MVAFSKCLTDVEFELLTMSTLMVTRCAVAGLLGHSGVVFHVDKFGHLSGHSSHYDYRFYPEKFLIPLPLIDHHNVIGHPHPIEEAHHEAFQLIDDGYQHHHPLYHFEHDYHADHHDFH